MKYTSYDLGYQSSGTTAVVTLHGTEANVKLLDSNNFASYRANRQHHYHGGHYRGSPVRLTIPHDGQWHVTVDLGGFAGTVRSSIEVYAP
jgi:hypothetical protein